MDDSVELRYYTQYDLIWKYHGIGEDFIIYIDFDWKGKLNDLGTTRNISTIKHANVYGFYSWKVEKS